MTNTTPNEDRLADACRVFGGVAADLVSALERLDDRIDKDADYISKLENRIGELEYEIEQLKA